MPPIPFPPEADNIAPERATVPPNTYPEGANPYPEKYNCLNPVWTRDNNNSLKGESSIALNSMHQADIIPKITELLDIPISNFITLAVNYCGYSGTIEDLIINYIYPLFMKSKAAESQ